MKPSKSIEIIKKKQHVEHDSDLNQPAYQPCLLFNGPNMKQVPVVAFVVSYLVMRQISQFHPWRVVEGTMGKDIQSGSQLNASDIEV